MSNEISILQQLTVSNGSLSLSRTAQFSVDQAAARKGGGGQLVGTAAGGEALVGLGDLTALGWTYFRNLDGTNYVELGVEDSGTFYPFARLDAGEAAMIRLAQGTTPYARANTADVFIEHDALNN